MQNALLVALSRQMALSRELDVVANNMANVNTNGFRREATEFREYLSPEAHQDNFRLSDRRISYVEDHSTWHDFEPGSFERTDAPLDVALEGDAFLTVQSPDGSGERYTRNGSLAIDAQGRLVTSAGLPVLTDGGVLTVDPVQDGEVTIGKDGTVSTRQGIKGHLKLATFQNPESLLKDGDSLFEAGSEPATTPAAGSVRVEQGMIERSNVKPVVEMSRLIEINRAYTTLATLIQNGDALRKTALDRLSDVPA